MPEAGFPDTYATETHTTTTTGCFLDLTVVRTLYGYIKIAEIVLDLLGFICIISSIFAYHSRGSFFNTVAMGGFWYSAIVLSFYVFHVTDKTPRIPWKKLEFVFCAIWTLFYLIAASLAASLSSAAQAEAFGAAAFFGYFAMIVYGYDAWHSFGFFRGTITVIKTTTTTATNAPTSPTTY